jgi:hypothetical protein
MDWTKYRTKPFSRHNECIHCECWHPLFFPSVIHLFSSLLIFSHYFNTWGRQCSTRWRRFSAHQWFFEIDNITFSGKHERDKIPYEYRWWYVFVNTSSIAFAVFFYADRLSVVKKQKRNITFESDNQKYFFTSWRKSEARLFFGDRHITSWERNPGKRVSFVSGLGIRTKRDSRIRKRMLFHTFVQKMLWQWLNVIYS